jgi:OMF family outer membrane factor
LGDWKLSLDDSIVLAFRNRAELEQLLLQRGIALDQARVALAALGPTLSIGAQYNLLDSFQDSFRPTNGYSVSLGARWTLFDGGAARSRSLQQEASAAIAESRFADTRNQIRSQVEDAYYQLKASAVNIGTNTKAVEQATEALRLARLRFQAGVGTQTDVINQEDALTRADASLVNAILSYNRAMASLFRAISNVTIKPVELTSPTPPSPPTKPSGPPP